MNPWLEDVRKFHEKFDVAAPKLPTHLSVDVADVRIRLHNEECTEVCDAIDDSDTAQVVAECCDQIFVALGTIICTGFDPEPMWRAICEANMKKVAPPGGGKILKPPGFESVQPHEILKDQLIVANGRTLGQS